MGWLGALLMLFIVIFGAFVLPTVLIGIVAISFDEASRKAENVQAMVSKMELVMDDARAKMPGYFTPSRMEKLQVRRVAGLVAGGFPERACGRGVW